MVFVVGGRVGRRRTGRGFTWRRSFSSPCADLNGRKTILSVPLPRNTSKPSDARCCVLGWEWPLLLLVLQRRSCLAVAILRTREFSTPLCSDQRSSGYNDCVKPTVFVVEDETDISRLVRHHLESAGYQVRTFAASTGVVADAEKTPPSLFLLDIMVPGGDGFELCRRIRSTASIA